MSRHGLLPILIIGLVGLVAVPMSHADYRRLFKAPADYIKKTQCPDVRERTSRKYDLGYDKHHSPRVRAWYSDVMSISATRSLSSPWRMAAVTSSTTKPGVSYLWVTTSCSIQSTASTLGGGPYGRACWWTAKASPGKPIEQMNLRATRPHNPWARKEGIFN